MNHFEKFMLDYVTKVFIQASYNKRLNALVYGLEEDKSSAWKKCEVTVQKFKIFFNGRLNINLHDVEHVYIHRLLQNSIKKNGKTVQKPIIVKLINTQVKNRIFSLAKNLKTFNKR